MPPQKHIISMRGRVQRWRKKRVYNTAQAWQLVQTSLFMLGTVSPHHPLFIIGTQTKFSGGGEGFSPIALFCNGCKWNITIITWESGVIVFWLNSCWFFMIRKCCSNHDVLVPLCFFVCHLQEKQQGPQSELRTDTWAHRGLSKFAGCFNPLCWKSPL